VSVLRAAAGVAVVLAALAVFQGSALVGHVKDDPFAFFKPVVTVSPSDRQRLDRGEVIVRVLPGRDNQLAVFAASRLDAEPESLVHWTGAIEQMKKGPFVLAIRRFSDPPVLSDLDGLMLDDVDVEAIRQCRRGECGVKLSENEIEVLRSAAEASGAGSRAAVQREFRRVLFNRVTRYRHEGLAGLPPYVDRPEPSVPRDAFAALVERSPHLRNHVPAITDALGRYPKAALPSVDSFLYWSKEHYGRGKPVTTITQVHIVRPGDPPLPAVMVLSQEIFASHYRTGSLGMTAFVVGRDDARYLVHLNRSQLDMLRGMFGGIVRSVLEGRLASEAKPAMATVKGRLESGHPYAAQ
jgi:hypothetical protein